MPFQSFKILESSAFTMKFLSIPVDAVMSTDKRERISLYSFMSENNCTQKKHIDTFATAIKTRKKHRNGVIYTVDLL